MRNLKSKLVLLICFQMWFATCEVKSENITSEPSKSSSLGTLPTLHTTAATLNTTTATIPTSTVTPNTTTATTSTPTTPNTTTPVTPPTTPNTTTPPTTLKPTTLPPPPPTTPNTTTTVAPTTTPITTTIAPKTTPKPQPDRKFDGPSFIGGMILTMGLMAIAFVAWKFYKARTERNYHTL